MPCARAQLELDTGHEPPDQREPVPVGKRADHLRQSEREGASAQLRDQFQLAVRALVECAIRIAAGQRDHVRSVTAICKRDVRREDVPRKAVADLLDPTDVVDGADLVLEQVAEDVLGPHPNLRLEPRVRTRGASLLA